MNDHNKHAKSRNVTAKDMVVLIVVIALMLPLFWYKEAGETWAIYLVALIPIAGLVYWLKIPAEKRVKAQQDAKKELNTTALGRGFKYFIWAFYVFAAIVLLKSFLGWVHSA